MRFRQPDAAVTRAVAALAVIVAGRALAAAPALAQEAAPAPPVVWVLATGGTIAGGGASSTSLTEYRAGAFTGAELVAALPALARHATIRVEQVANVGSPNITFEDWLALATRIDAIFRDDPDASGVVITHGTNTLEETAYFLNLTVRHDRPVVLVGAQRPATAISADGPLNLLNAVRAAASPEARGKGVLVVLNDEINAARDVTRPAPTGWRRSAPPTSASSAMSTATAWRSTASRRAGTRPIPSSTWPASPRSPASTSSTPTWSRTRC